MIVIGLLKATYILTGYACVRTVDTTYRFWRKADWVSDGVNQVFRLDEDTGHVVVKQAGVYLVYAQVQTILYCLCFIVFC